MQRKSSTKSIIILVAIIALAALIYFYVSGTPKDTSSVLVSDVQTTEVTDKAQKIIALLNQANSLKIDASLFTSPVYKSLVDHTVPVQDQAVGKSNPFFYTRSAPAKK